MARDSFSFRFLGNAVVVYHNPERKDTFGPGGVGVGAYDLVYYDGSEKMVESGALEGPVVLDVREGRVRRIDALLSAVVDAGGAIHVPGTAGGIE